MDAAAPKQVTIQVGSDRWQGILLPSTADLLRLRFDDEHVAPTDLPLRTHLHVEMPPSQLPEPAIQDARLVGVDINRRGYVVVTIEVRAGTIDDTLDPAEDTGNRRVWVRVGPNREEELEVPVRLLDGPPAARHLVARLRDASAGGLGLVFPQAAEDRLCRVRSFVATVAWPGFPSAREWTCEVRNRTAVDGGVRYGVQFRTDMAETAPPGPKFEPLWNCAFCGAPGLLAESHAHCPMCGMPQGDVETRLPDWDALVTAATHRFSGVDLTCGSCGVAHSSAAVHCANCGRML